MSTPQSYEFHHVNFDREMERLRGQLMLSWKKEAQQLVEFGLHDGMSILEVGSGSGIVTEQLLLAFTNSTITCVELAPEMVQHAEHYLAEKSEEHWQIITGSVMQMPFAENQFDFAIARFLFQHLLNPLAAACEIWRVLKPGGKLVILDSDLDLAYTSEPRNPNREQINKNIAEQQAARGGNRYIGRLLPRILKESGFIEPQLEAIISHTDILGIEPFFFELAPDRQRVQPLIDAGKMTEEEFNNRQVRFERQITDPNFLMMLILLAACGTKRI